MALDLQILRTAKAALDEGLLNAADYDSMKASFIKAQSIKAGVEAGFISESDYAEARAAFFSGLGMPVGGVVSAHSQPVAAAPVTTAKGNGAAQIFSKPPSAKPQPPPASAAVTAAGSVASGKSQASAKSELETEVQPASDVPPLSLPDGQAQAETCSTPTTGGSRSASLLPTPTGLTDRGGKSAAADKVGLVALV